MKTSTDGRFWNARAMAQREGLKAVQMFEAIERGEIKALWVMATNPAVSLPRAAAVREALGKLELFVVSENVLSNDTVNSGAHILLRIERIGDTELSLHRRHQLHQALRPLARSRTGVVGGFLANDGTHEVGAEAGAPRAIIDNFADFG